MTSILRGFVLSALLLTPVAAERLCFTETLSWFCCQKCDLPLSLPGIGFATSGDSCETSEMGVFSLSASSSDPYVNSGPLPADGMLYLWIADGLLRAGPSYGFGSCILDLQGDVDVVTYEPLSGGGEWADWAQQLWIYPACPTEQQLLGVVRIKSSAVTSRSWGGVKALWR